VSAGQVLGSVSPDDALVVCADKRGELSIWDARTGQLLRSIAASGDPIESVAIALAGGTLGLLVGYAGVLISRQFRIPTDLAYRVYVDYLMRPPAVAPAHAQQLRGELEGQRAAVEAILSRAAQVLGVLTNELGVAVTPTIDEAVLDRLDLLQVSTERLLLVLALRSGAVRTIFVEVPAELAAEAVQKVTVAGTSACRSHAERSARCSPTGCATRPRRGRIVRAEHLVQEAEGLDADRGGSRAPRQHAAARGQPEFATRAQLQGPSRTERRDLCAMRSRHGRRGLTITIGQSTPTRGLDVHAVTSTYRCGPLTGVIGVMGPTRMAYDKTRARQSSRLVGELLE
jgi:heat-inducible transcriptional repressor